MKRSGSRTSKISNDPQDYLENSLPGIPDVKWHEFLEKEETDFFILGLREEIFNKCIDLCFENYLEKQAVAFTVHCAYLAWCKVFDIFYMFRDPGDTDDPEVKETWEPDQEPEPSIIDSWGSECILPSKPSKVLVKKESSIPKTTPRLLSEQMESLESCSFVSDLFDSGEEEYFFYPTAISSSTSTTLTQRLSIFTRTLSMSRASLPLIHPKSTLLQECNEDLSLNKKKKSKKKLIKNAV